MARRGAQSGEARPQPGVRAIHEDFRPVFEWKYGKEAQQSHVLLIQLPGFAKEQVKVSTEGTNNLRIRGERLIVSGNKWSRFEEDFRIPDDCNIRGIRAKFENGTLTITMPKKGPITTTLVSPKKEETHKAKLEEVKENQNWKAMEKVEESKKDEVSKKADEANKENDKGLSKPKIYLEEIEKKDEEKIKEAKEHDIEKSKKVTEGLNVGKETKKEEPFKSKNYFENIKKKITSGEVKEMVNKKYEEVVDGIRTKGKELLKPKNYTEKITKKNEKYEEVMKSRAKSELEEKRQLMVNMGVAVLVIVTLGAYIYYGSFKKANV